MVENRIINETEESDVINIKLNDKLKKSLLNFLMQEFKVSKDFTGNACYLLSDGNYLDVGDAHVNIDSTIIDFLFDNDLISADEAAYGVLPEHFVEVELNAIHCGNDHYRYLGIHKDNKPTDEQYQALTFYDDYQIKHENGYTIEVYGLDEAKRTEVYYDADNDILCDKFGRKISAEAKIRNFYTTGKFTLIEKNMKESVDRERWIEIIKNYGKNYNFDKYSDKQLYCIAQRLLNAPIKDIDQEIEEPYYERKKCPKCGMLLNDSGECPVCDLGDESALEEGIYLQEKIVKKGSKYQVQSEKGRNMGTYDTKKEAEKRLKQIEYFKHLNENKEEKLYHVSEKLLDGIMHPEIPESAYEEQETPRICFAKTIQGCLIGAFEDKDLTGKVLHVYSTVSDYYQPTKEEVADVEATGEVWILHDVEPEYEYDIKIIGSDETKIYKIRDNEFEVPIWKYEIINKDMKENLTEATRNQVLSKSKSGKGYKDKSKGSRWTRKDKCHISNNVKDYNRIDMDSFWKKDLLSFKLSIVGETQTYTVTIEFNNILRNIQNEVKAAKNKFDRDIVYKALMTSINNGQIKYDCSCDDFKYRLSYQASKNGYKAGEQETRPSDETNPDDALGAACKHILFALNNSSWLRNIASVIVNYANYCKDNMEYNYSKYIFPKIFNMDYKKAVQMCIDDYDENGNIKDNLKSDEATINLANAIGRIRGRIKPGSNKNPAAQKSEKK